MRLKDINYNSIEAIQAAGPYAVIHFRNGQTFVAARSLKYLQSVWPQLARISRSHAVNPDHVALKGEKEVIMRSNRTYAVSRPWEKNKKRVVIG